MNYNLKVWKIQPIFLSRKAQSAEIVEKKRDVWKKMCVCGVCGLLLYLNHTDDLLL